MNGNNYITDDVVNMELLSDNNLTTVNIGGVDYADMICTNIWQEDGHTRFIIREMTEMEKIFSSRSCFVVLPSSSALLTPRSEALAEFAKSTLPSPSVIQTPSKEDSIISIKALLSITAYLLLCTRSYIGSTDKSL